MLKRANETKGILPNVSARVAIGRPDGANQIGLERADER